MTLNELLRRHLSPEITQKTVAMDWLARLPKTGGKHQRAPSYVETRLSRCFKGEPAAVRFFFAEREHAVLLLEVMAVPEGERDELLAAADRAMTATGEPPPRLVIDLTKWSSLTTAKQLFDTLRVHVIEQPLLQPAVLLLTDTLYDVLPRSFDAAKWLRVDVVDAVDAPACVLELTSGGALLASPARQVEPERWLAIDYDEARQSLMLEPSDGISRFARDGKLPLPPIEHDLATCVAGAAPAASSAAGLGPLEVRRLMARLRDDAEAERVDPDPRNRLAMASALGIAATATPRDRVEADLRGAAEALGVAEAPPMSEDAFRALIDKARRRPSPQVVVRVGNELHCVNPGSAQPGLEHPRVRVHRFEPPEPWIARLRAAVVGWTIGDFEADPFLIAAMERLDPERRDVLPLLHARAWLLRTSIPKPQRAEPIADWRPAVRLLLSARIPEAMLRLTREDSRQDTRNAASYTIEPHGRVANELPLVDANTATSLRHVCSPSPSVPFSRRAPLRLAAERPHSWGGPVRSRLVLPRAADAVSVDEQWLDAYEGMMGGSAPSASGEPAIDCVPIRESLPWQQADALLATTWLALRAAIDHAPAVRAESGGILLSLGSMIAAQISVTENTHDVGQLQAMLDWNSNRGGSDLLTTSIAAGVDSVKCCVPAGVVLRSGRIRAEIRFTASPLLLGLGSSMILGVAAEGARATDDDD